MKIIILAAALVGLASATLDVYPTKYDTLDINSIIHNKRLFGQYFECIVKVGHCNEEGNLLREIIPDALITDCSKCNQHQRESVDLVINFLTKEHPDKFKRLTDIYDPKGVYQHKYAHYLH